MLLILSPPAQSVNICPLICPDNITSGMSESETFRILYWKCIVKLSVALTNSEIEAEASCE